MYKRQYVDSDVMGNLIDYMEENPDIGIITPLIKNVDGSIQQMCIRDRILCLKE